MSYTVLALALCDVRDGAEQSAIEGLRLLVEYGLDAESSRVLSGVSFGPKASMLLAFEGVHADLVIRAAEAIARQSLSMADDGETAWAVAGVITQGDVDRVDIFGQSWNFVGWPTIAAARILPCLEAGRLAIEGDVACREGERTELGAIRTVASKRGERYKIGDHRRIRFNSSFKAARPHRLQSSVTTPTIGAPVAAGTAGEGTHICQLLQVVAFPGGQGVPRIHERHELSLPAGGTMGELVIPLALCAPRDTATAVNSRVVGIPFAFDESGPLEVDVVPPSMLGGSIGLRLPQKEGPNSLHRVVDVVYQPEPIKDMVSIRLCARKDYEIKQAHILLWGDRQQLRSNVAAFSIGTGSDRGRHPMIAACFELETDPYARVWEIAFFDADFDHEITWHAVRVI